MPSPHMTALDTLNAHLGQNPIIGAILQRAPELQMPNWYLGAGCLAQTVWNGLHGFPAAQHIKDYDLVYFDAADTSYDGEDAYIRRGAHVFADLPAEIEIRNQARVHLWYAQHFGYPIRPYTSVEDAIDSWPTTATSLGITCDVRGEWVVVAACKQNSFDLQTRAGLGSRSLRIRKPSGQQSLRMSPQSLQRACKQHFRLTFAANSVHSNKSIR